MQSPQEPQYFTLQQPQSEEPKQGFLTPQAAKRIGFGIGVLALLLFGGIFARNLFTSLRSGPQNALEAAQAEIAQRQAECEEGNKECEAQAQTAVARASGVVQACEGLEVKQYENCVTLIARAKKDVAVCSELSEESQVVCEDSVLLARVADGEGMALCAEVVNEAKRHSCEAVVTATARALGECAKYGVAEDVCRAQEAIDNLLLAGNVQGCATFGEEERVWCVELFASTDADGDGLSAQTESELGTSDANADTDGDGYPDGQEVRAGYNPRE